jgi:carboxypeptidase C (cathepsin A)
VARGHHLPDEEIFMRRPPAIPACLLLVLAWGLADAQQSAPSPTPPDPVSEPQRHTQAPNPAPTATPVGPSRLPADLTTHHTLELPDRTLHFGATAGSIRLSDDKGSPRADIAFTAYQLEDTDPRTRKVTFVLNGGPGFASAWLQVGAVGPWRISFGGDGPAPSISAEPVPNTETWLDFTDLVFIDPADTGFSRVLSSSEDVRKRMFSVDGDIAYLAETIRLWVDRYARDVSPKYLLGESYGGFRAPRLARELASVQGTGVSGLVLVSPALDLGGRSRVFDPFAYAIKLPTMTAVVRAAHGPVTRTGLEDVELYAATEFLVDATRGERDATAMARRSIRVAEFVGLDAAVVARYHGLIDNEIFLHELNRASGRVASEYDATVTIADPWPLEAMSHYPDPILEGLKAPVSTAMVTIYETRLNWHPEYAYRLESPSASRQWDWGNRLWNQPQAMGAMRTALALDPRLRVLIGHGLFDLVTPYFGTQLLVDQIPDASGGNRVRLATYAGGHMFYGRDEARAAFREDARKMYSGEQ